MNHAMVTNIRNKCTATYRHIREAEAASGGPRKRGGGDMSEALFAAMELLTANWAHAIVPQKKHLSSACGGFEVSLYGDSLTF